MVDRIYRSLFVYSMGFFELIKKCLSHSTESYQVIKALWKAYMVLTEFCCQTDYKTILSEIVDNHKKEMEIKESDYKS